MNKIKFILAFLLALALYSCVDTEERIVINADESGSYTLTIDLSKLIELSNQMMPDSTRASKPKEKKDSIIYFKNFIDTSQNLTAEEKALYRDGYLHIDMDEANNKMKVEMGCPFKNSTQLTQVKNNFLKVADKLKLFNKTKDKGLNDMTDNTEEGEKGFDDKSINPMGGNSTFTAIPGKISNVINVTDEMKKSMANDSTLAMMQQMTMMTGDMTYRTVVVLPKSAKLAEGPDKILSADGKTVTFSFSLTDMMETPEKASYKIEY
jgi:hypothetical protein